MKITYISSQPGCGNSTAMSAIATILEQQGHAVLSVTGDGTTAGILGMCSKPVPFAIMLHEYDPSKKVDLAALEDEPRLANVLCFVETALTQIDAVMCPNCMMIFDPAQNGIYTDHNDVLLLEYTRNMQKLVASSNGILTKAADSEGGDHD